MPFPVPYRRFAPSVHARKRDRHGAYDRRRYHDGLRRVPAGRLAARLCRQVARSDRALARPLFQPLPPDLAQIRPLPGAVPHRTGLYLSRPAGAGGRKCQTVRRGRLCHRRSCRRRADRRDVRDDRGGECHPARRPPPLPDGGRHADQHPRRNRPGCRYVRLRDAHAQRT